MTRRIAAHRRERPDGWVTIEEPCDLLGALDRVGTHDAIVLDCVTVWTANLMLADGPEIDVVATAAAVAARLSARPGRAMVVSNEVGMGVHPYSELGRRYRDLLGAVNVRFSAEAARAGLVVAGRVLALEPTGEWLA
jgi:adenosyl cobinamide kinase/adenosyl cobinamide phosphate guanylyltransferase